jgi:hypothetical protein
VCVCVYVCLSAFADCTFGFDLKREEAEFSEIMIMPISSPRYFSLSLRVGEFQYRIAPDTNCQVPESSPLYIIYHIESLHRELFRILPASPSPSAHPPGPRLSRKKRGGSRRAPSGLSARANPLSGVFWRVAFSACAQACGCEGRTCGCDGGATVSCQGEHSPSLLLLFSSSTSLAARLRS